MQDTQFLPCQVQSFLDSFDGIIVTSHCYRFVCRASPSARPSLQPGGLVKSFLSLAIITQLVIHETQIQICLWIVRVQTQRFLISIRGLLPPALSGQGQALPEELITAMELRAPP